MVNRVPNLSYKRYCVLFCHRPTDKNKYNIVGRQGKAAIFRSIKAAENGVLSIIVRNKIKREDCDWVIFKELSDEEYSNL